MKVQLYSGASSLVARSGIGQALFHQQAILSRKGIATTLANSHDADIVHINTVFPDAPLAARKAHRRGQKVVYYAHSTMEDFRNSFRGSNQMAAIFKRWLLHCYKEGDIIITPTPYSRKLLQGYGLKLPIAVVSNGVDTSTFQASSLRGSVFRARYDLDNQEKVVISIGHQIVRKGILDFILLARLLPNVRFFWFGHTPSYLIPSNVRKAIKNAPQNLCFTGYVDQAALRDAYCGSDLFCFMSHEETEGIVVLEALACGIPVLVSDIPVYSDWLEDGKNVYKAADLADFYSKTVAILDGAVADCTAAGRAVAEARSFEAIGSELMRIYSTL